MPLKTCPFEVGKRYVVLKDVSFLNHHFQRGSVVVFKTHAYDFHEGVTRYWFENADGSETNVWHDFDNKPDTSETWQQFFTPEADSLASR
jgi:hypothetical protein